MKLLSFQMFSVFKLYLLRWSGTVKYQRQFFDILGNGDGLWKRELFSFLTKYHCLKKKGFNLEEGVILSCFVGIRWEIIVREYVYPLLMKMLSVINGLCN